MPNHSYNIISVEKKYADRLMEIANEGLCRYYFPMPEELDDSVSGSESAKPDWQKKSSEELKEKYGFDNWYDWCCHNWGTKWGCYDNQIDDGVYTFTSAWCPPNDRVLEALAKDIPNFVFTFEEETGWGGEYQYQDGKLLESMVYDSPDFWDVDWDARIPAGELYQLKKPYTNSEGTFDAGFYAHASLQEYYGSDINDAIEGYKDDHNI